MTQHQFACAVRQREAEAKQNPNWYRFRVFLLMTLAYAFIGLLFLFSLGLLAGTVFLAVLMIKGHVALTALRLLLPVAIGALTLALVILRSLWVTLPEPSGVSLTRQQALPLFQEIDRLRSAMGVAPFHHVLINDDVNAAIVQTPRFGLFGGQKNTLILGIPLMLLVSPDQFRGVIAHEMGHIGGGHGVMGGWAFRMEHTWRTLLLTLLEDDHAGSLPMLWFFSWYVPYFAAFSFALRRQDEFDADRAAAKAVGAKTLAECLLHLALTEKAFSIPQEERKSPPDSRTLVRWLNEVTHDAPQHEVDDTHPPLAARLRSLEQKAFVPDRFETCAAEKYLGHNLPHIAQSVGIVFRDAPAAPSVPAAPSAPPHSADGGLQAVGA